MDLHFLKDVHMLINLHFIFQFSHQMHELKLNILINYESTGSDLQSKQRHYRVVGRGECQESICFTQGEVHTEPIYIQLRHTMENNRYVGETANHVLHEILAV